MKVLIAAACIAIVAAVGYYFWGEYQSWKSATDIAQREADARSEMFFVSKIDPAAPDVEKQLHQWCASTRKKLETNELSGETVDLARRLVGNCRALGYL